RFSATPCGGEGKNQVFPRLLSSEDAEYIYKFSDPELSAIIKLLLKLEGVTNHLQQ
ncbi:unnamed protein product, partial [Larinioides sclopetarius]